MRANQTTIPNYCDLVKPVFFTIGSRAAKSYYQSVRRACGGDFAFYFLISIIRANLKQGQNPPKKWFLTGYLPLAAEGGSGEYYERLFSDLFTFQSFWLRFAIERNVACEFLTVGSRASEKRRGEAATALPDGFPCL